ncbi:hypothetical protein JCM19231_1175 [Vibrio ishigakensis]|uniref:Uncharacterized protein n=1 Tax=Vibrio ishigakensis TaxID=1481914 RepID=A0A0B8P3D1_9VIBR|nr:hypothetical protein JCM19231_1175 [Vibrio ishigakensis]
MLGLFEGVSMAVIVIVSPAVISMLILSRKQGKRRFDDNLAQPRD